MLTPKTYHKIPFFIELQERYRALRRDGVDREAAVQRLCLEYDRELSDPDDSVCFWVSIALILARKKELYPPIQAKALCQLSTGKAVFTENMTPEELQRLKNHLSDMGQCGAEAVYLSKKKYMPNWKVGDTFYHLLKHPACKKAGIMHWYLLLRKVGEYENHNGETMQLLYATLCPHDRLPKTIEELNSLGFLRLMPHDHKWDYLLQARIQSKRAENELDLHKLGSFPNAAIPDNAADEDPVVSYPLFRGRDHEANTPAYESAICLCYKNNGIQAHSS